MPAIIAGIILLLAFIREGLDLFRQPNYRALLVWVGVILALGTVFFHYAESWNWLDSLYFSVVTLATVGYGDMYPTTELGKAFTIIYILLGLGLIATFASMLAQDRLSIAKSRQASANSEGESGEN